MSLYRLVAIVCLKVERKGGPLRFAEERIPDVV
eukprot:CAMPEP_0118904722 /NCGR_PEP_ID=MMETSP1166-20130328/9068_1 /TAXON_ID=1104430 /ORGANISM="Chrysoreinhardia sp, Strain CCMP3193" /LENGTH=32 /DNA_ID= /DNA_START= /DNA_END= /DNA_ORIENTATION=